MTSKIPHQPAALDPLTPFEQRAERGWIDPLLRECMEKVNRHVPMTIDWSRRFTNKMGRARTFWLQGSTPLRVRQGVLTFSASALWRRASVEERRAVVIHEAAHILANDEIGGDAGHGWAWKSMMLRLGASPERCHSVNTQGLRRPRRGHAAPPVYVPQSAPRQVVINSNLFDALVSFNANGNELVGRVIAISGSDYVTVQLVGDHSAERFGKFHVLHKSEARLA